MEKLIELLNEYEKSITEIPVYWWKANGILQYWSYIQQVSVMYIISKHYGFIKRLVDNDKIWDNKNSDRYTMMKLMRAEINEWIDVFEWTERYEFVIMLLSIQDEPIEFLISILK